MGSMRRGEGPPGGRQVDDGFVEVIAVFCAALAQRPWGSPPLLSHVTRDEVTAPWPGAQTSEAWSVAAPDELAGDLFDALAGRRVGASTDGVVAVVDTTVDVTGGDSPLALDLAVQADSCGRCDVRTVTAVLRDGSGTRVVAVRDGSLHRLGAPPPGRATSALLRTVGAPSAFGATPSALTAAVRVWLLAQLCTVEEFVGDFSADTGVPLVDAGDTMVRAVNRIPGFTESFPSPIRHLLDAHRTGWAAVLERFAGDVDGIRWLFERGWTNRSAAPIVSDRHAVALLEWCDPAMLAHLFDRSTPTFAELEDRHRGLVAASVMSTPFAELTELATSQVASFAT